MVSEEIKATRKQINYIRLLKKRTGANIDINYHGLSMADADRIIKQLLDLERRQKLACANLVLELSRLLDEKIKPPEEPVQEAVAKW